MTRKKTRPGDGELSRRIAVTLPRLLREFSRDFDRRMLRGMRQRGHPDIRAAHMAVFSNIGLGRARVTELAERARITQQAMGKTLRELEQLGYVERAIDPEDRRAKAIRVTDKGIHLAEVTLEVIEEIEAQYREKLGAALMSEFDSTLRRVVLKLDLDYLPAGWSASKED